MDGLVSVVIAIWWAIACGVVGVGVGSADGQGIPQSDWRHAVLSLMWVEVRWQGLGCQEPFRSWCRCSLKSKQQGCSAAVQ